jgi:DNA adenine methylase
MITPIRWAGSKKALLPHLRKYWALTQTRYIEPFCGSACLFFDTEPSKAILGDINRELIVTYQSIKDDPEAVIGNIRAIRKTKSNYYRVRTIDPSTLSPNEMAARFIYLNRYCFNGIYRTNLDGQFNVPYGKPKYRVHFDFDTIRQMSALLRTTELISGDFQGVLKKATVGDFVYLDPPYAVASRRVFAEYHPDTFSNDDLQRLSDVLTDLDRRQVHFVVSYADSTEGRTLLANWNPRRVRTRRNVAGFAGHRRLAYELIASNRELTNVE